MATLENSLPQLQAAEAQLRALATAHGIAYHIADFGGRRTAADTTLILGYRAADYAVYAARERAAGRVPVSIERFRPVSSAQHSYHNRGGAFDVRMDKGTYAQLGALAAQAGLTWGGTFQNPDQPHFQLAIPLSQLDVLYAAQPATFRAGAVSPAIIAALSLVVLFLWWLK